MMGFTNFTARSLAVLAVALAALVTPAMASADTTPPPDRVDRVGVAPLVAPAQLPPDRVDGLGSARLAYVPVPTVIVRTTGSGAFNWADAVVGAASALGVTLLAGAALTARGRRRMPAPS